MDSCTAMDNKLRDFIWTIKESLLLISHLLTPSQPPAILWNSDQQIHNATHSVGLICSVGVSNIWNKFNKNLKWTVHWIVIETNLELLSGSITPNNRSYTIVLILKLARFRLRRALLKGLQKGMLPSRVFDQKTTSKHIW